MRHLEEDKQSEKTVRQPDAEGEFQLDFTDLDADLLNQMQNNIVPKKTSQEDYLEMKKNMEKFVLKSSPGKSIISLKGRQLTEHELEKRTVRSKIG